MLQAKVPAGRHRVILTYWPAAFTQGLVLAAIAVFGLSAAGVLESVRRRRGTGPSVGGHAGGPKNLNGEDPHG
jgi:hypothetical protein